MCLQQYPRFHKLMAEMSGMVFALIGSQVLPLVDGLPDRLRSGDRRITGCGSGRAVVKLIAQGVRREPFTIIFRPATVAAGTGRRLGWA